jgi:hypothetical protein
MLPDPRQQMIDETSRWLTWALAADRGLPRIPRCRVDEGGFAELVARPEGRALAYRWWDRTLASQELAAPVVDASVDRTDRE